MIIYRPQRGLLADAMAEAREFNDEKEMKEFIAKDRNGNISIDDIVIKSESTNDDRIGWKDERYVCTNRCGEKDYIKLYGEPQCVGYCATDYPSN